MLAQITDDSIGLGGTFDSLKVDVKKYADIIRQFTELYLESSKYSDANGYNLDAITQAIEGCDKRSLLL